MPRKMSSTCNVIKNELKHMMKYLREIKLMRESGWFYQCNKELMKEKIDTIMCKTENNFINVTKLENFEFFISKKNNSEYFEKVKQIVNSELKTFDCIMSHLEFDILLNELHNQTTPQVFVMNTDFED